MNKLNTFLFFSKITEPSDSTLDLVKLISIIAIALLALILFILSGNKRRTDTRSMVFGAICIALSFALSFIKIPFAFGGSITLASFVPLLVYSYFYGPVKGLLAGVVYGLLQFIQESYFLTPIQFLLDYILAFASITFAGVFKNVIKDKNFSVITGVILVGSFRLLMHIFAGIIFFNAGDAYRVADLPASSALLYSTIYNLLYVAPDILITLGVIIFMLYRGYYTRISGMMLKKD